MAGGGSAGRQRLNRKESPTASDLFALNEAPYGRERSFNALRLASTIAGKAGARLCDFKRRSSRGL